MVAIWLRDRTFLQIGASDGSRTIFYSTNKSFLLEVKNFLLLKINDRNVTSTNHFHFGDNIEGDKVVGTKASTTNTTMVNGSGNQVIAGGASGARIAGSASAHFLNDSPGAQIGTGNMSSGNNYQITRIDYSNVLPQIEQRRQFYAQQPQSNHLEQRLTELEALMRSGSPSPQGKSRVRELASDLGSILHAYPTMVQLFYHIRQLVGI